MVEFPLYETQNIMEAMEQAEKAGDLKALQWCARFLITLWDDAEVCRVDDFSNSAHMFNRMWDSLLKSDPAPESIAAIINRKEEPEPPTVSGNEKLTEEKYREIVERLGGEIGDPSCCVDFPDTLRITTKKDALDLLNVLMGEGKEVEHFTITQETPFRALKAAIERGIA